MTSPARRFVDGSSLEFWEMIGHGGFGHVYKARHRRWCSNVAIKILRLEDRKSLVREMDMMLQASSPFVIQVLGIFRGPLPFAPPSEQLGLVMELMDRGSLSSLQTALRGTPPWPLVFRLAHQVALGINFLHSLSPPVLHLDLKPSNVLLDPFLSAKLTDFGLSRFYHSSSQLSKMDGEEEGGTLPYMPPEAFDVCYKPTRASDVYSYGVLLWSIVTGRKPYENAISTIVRLQIPNGQRPSLDEIRARVSGLAGSEGLMFLMMKSWEKDPKERPSSVECATLAEELYKVHKHGIVDAVHQVLKKLDRQEGELTERLRGGRVPPGRTSGEEDILHASVPTGSPPVQEMFGGRTQTKPQRFKDSQRPTDKSDVDTGPNLDQIRSSVHPILSAPLSPSTAPSAQGFARRTSQKVLNQCSSMLTCFPVRPPPEFYISMNNVTGIQCGNNNAMHISTTARHERRRHPTAPPTVNLPPTQPGRG